MIVTLPASFLAVLPSQQFLIPISYTGRIFFSFLLLSWASLLRFFSPESERLFLANLTWKLWLLCTQHIHTPLIQFYKGTSPRWASCLSHPVSSPSDFWAAGQFQPYQAELAVHIIINSFKKKDLSSPWGRDYWALSDTDNPHGKELLKNMFY